MKTHPGPWKITAKPDGEYPVFDIGCEHANGDVDLVCDVRNEGHAHLIAAAPDLLAALEMVRDADEDCRRDGLPQIPLMVRAAIDAALAKATDE